MKFSIISTILFTSVALSNPHHRGGSASHWEPAGPNDYRGPCPMLNTLANHKFLPHDGRNITKDVVIYALSRALNFNESLASLMFDMAIVANPQPNATYFTLDQLNRHNVLEHDASLSRSDAYFGNNNVFNQSIFDETKAYWTGPILDANMLANGKLARQINSKAYNPTYTFTAMMEHFSLGEVAAPVIAFGDMEAGLVNRTLVEYFFEHERLPTHLGWTKPKEIVSQEDVMKVTRMISKAANLITSSSSSAVDARHWDVHAGLIGQQ